MSETGTVTAPKLGPQAWAWDHRQAEAPVLKPAGLKPRVVLTGHGDPLTGDDLTGTLTAAADRF